MPYYIPFPGIHKTAASEALQPLVDAAILGNSTAGFIIDNKKADIFYREIWEQCYRAARRIDYKNIDDAAQVIFEHIWVVLKRYGGYHNGYPFRAILLRTIDGARSHYNRENKRQKRCVNMHALSYDEITEEIEDKLHPEALYLPANYQFSLMGFRDGFSARYPEMEKYIDELIRLININDYVPCSACTTELLDLLYAHGLSTHNIKGTDCIHTKDICLCLYDKNNDAAYVSFRAMRNKSQRATRKRKHVAVDYVCEICGEWKPDTDYTHGKNGYSRVCRCCTKNKALYDTYDRELRRQRSEKRRCRTAKRG